MVADHVYWYIQSSYIALMRDLCHETTVELRLTVDICVFLLRTSKWSVQAGLKRNDICMSSQSLHPWSKH